MRYIYFVICTLSLSWDWRNEINVVYCGEGIRELVGPGDDPIPAL